MKRNIFKKLIILFSFIFSYLLYYSSLEKCLDGFDICAKKVRWIIFKLIESIISYAITAILLELVILKIISKYHLIHLFVIYNYFYYYSHGLDFDNHGYFNFLGFITIVPLILLSLFPFTVLIILYKKNKTYIAKYIGVILLTIIYYFFFSSQYMNCKDWAKGLNNTYIDNDMNIHGCYLKIPKICPYKIGKYIFDLSKWKNIDCNENRKNTKKTLLKFSNYKYLNDDSKRIGFPLINKDPELIVNFNEHDNKLLNYTKHNLVDMDREELVKRVYKENRPEIIVDYSKNPFGEIVIDLKYNQTLSKERKKLEKNSIPYSENIIILYIDSASRPSSIRQLKKTLNFFEKFMPYKGGYNGKFPNETFHSFQFFKYHSLKGYTWENYPTIFYGSRAGKKIVRIIKHFKINGYVTSYNNEGCCLRDLTTTGHNMTLEEIGDHEFIICDPNRENGNSLIKRCLYNKLVTEHLYEYGKQFWKQYKHNRKFLIIASSDGHEGTLEVLKYIDNSLFNFLNDLFNEHLLKDTTVFLLSDHGASMPSPYYMTEFFQTEISLPMLYIICNDRKDISYYQQYSNIHKNQQVLTAVNL